MQTNNEDLPVSVTPSPNKRRKRHKSGYGRFTRNKQKYKQKSGKFDSERVCLAPDGK